MKIAQNLISYLDIVTTLHENSTFTAKKIYVTIILYFHYYSEQYFTTIFIEQY